MGLKYPAAVKCQQKDTDAFLALYDFFAEHWEHLWTLTRSSLRYRPAQNDPRSLSQKTPD